MGSEPVTAVLLVYQFPKFSGEGPGLDELADSMGKRFAHKSTKPKSAEP